MQPGSNLAVRTPRLGLAPEPDQRLLDDLLGFRRPGGEERARQTEQARRLVGNQDGEGRLVALGNPRHEFPVEAVALAIRPLGHSTSPGRARVLTPPTIPDRGCSRTARKCPGRGAP